MNAILELRQAALPKLSPRLAEMKRRIRAGEHHRFRSTQTRWTSWPNASARV